MDIPISLLVYIIYIAPMQFGMLAGNPASTVLNSKKKNQKRGAGDVIG
jgi:hypothetical protein